MKKRVYWCVNYRDSLGKMYSDDHDLKIFDNHLKDLMTEFKCLKDHKYKIIEKNHVYGYVIIEDSNLKDLVPYVKHKPFIGRCEESGFPCKQCIRECDTWGKCIEEII